MSPQSFTNGPSASSLRLLAFAVLILVTAQPVAAAAPDQTFINDHCTCCHNDVDKKGRLDLTRLAIAPTVPPTWPSGSRCMTA